ncbi:MAG: chromate transporter [Dehalococcoidia bacterium]|nr:chromate transporter [Dehalococcoidia bacterium]
MRLPRLPFRRGANAIAPLFMATPTGYALPELFLVFLKIGAVLYGSGYVLIAFVEADLVVAREWLTAQQLVDAIAVGQFTPGPVFTTATFIGYVIDGIPGALAATAGIFLPSFIFVALTHPLIPRLRNSPWAAPFLDGVNAAALALMLVVCARLAQDAIEDFYSAGLFVLGAAVLIRYSPNSVWLILAGAAAGVLHAFLT